MFGVDMPVLYEPGKALFSTAPAGQFDGVICINYLDQLHADKLVQATQDIAQFSKQWAFIAISKSGSRREIDWWHDFLPLYFLNGQKLVIRETK